MASRALTMKDDDEDKHVEDALAGENGDQVEQAKKFWQRVQDAIQPVLMDLNQMASEAVQKRRPIEERWLEDLRQYHGIYDPDTEAVFRADKDRSRIFIRITRVKTKAWAARLGDMLFPNDEKNWGIQPTPVPELAHSARAAAKQADELEAQANGIVDSHNQQVDAGGPGVPDQLPQAQAMMQQAGDHRMTEKDVQAQVEEASKRCDAMEREIDDQLTESRYPMHCRQIIRDLCKLGSGVLKGPVLAGTAKKSWANAGGRFELKASSSMTPGARRVNPWHFFPDPNAESVEEAEFFLERHLPNKKMLRGMSKEIGFNEDSVRKLLEDGPRSSSPGSGGDLSFINQLRVMESTAGIADSSDYMRDRYVVWEWHGSLEGCQIADMVRAMGRFQDAEDIDKDWDPLDTYQVRIFFCDNVLLKIDELWCLDSGDCLYSVASFSEGETCILGGIGVPRIMNSEQTMLNSAVRMMMDNAALAVSPQVVIDKEHIQPENNSWKLTPRKIWLRIKSVATPGQQQAPVFETHEIPLNQQMLAGIIQIAQQFVDVSVAMPMLAQGEAGQTAHDTAAGLTLLFNSANVTFRDVVKSWDDGITAPTIRRFYDFNMQFSDKDEIKGDMQVEARGTAVLMVRQQQAEQLMLMIREWATHPILGVGFRAYHAARLVLQALSITPDDVLLPEDEYMAKLKQMSQSAGQDDGQAAAAALDAKTKVQVATITAQSREKVAELTAQTEFAKLGQQKDITVAQVQAMFQTAQMAAEKDLHVEEMRAASKERALAAEIAVESQQANADRAMGMVPKGSGGNISLGADKPIQPSDGVRPALEAGLQ